MIVKIKKKNGKRILSAILAFLMVISILPINVFTTLADDAARLSVILVTKDDGSTPIEDAKVTIIADDEPVWVGNTDENGQAEFVLSDDGIYQYKVEKIGYETISGTVDLENGNQIMLTAKTTVTISGIVKDMEDNGISEAAVKLTGYCEYEAETDDEGNFSIDNVYADEEYIITVSAGGYKTKRVTDLNDVSEIVLEEKDTPTLSFTEQEVTVKYGSTVTRTVQVSNDAKVSYFSEDEEIATVDENGTVTPVGIGQTVIRATTEETEDSLSGTVGYTLIIEKGEQEPLVFEEAHPDAVFYGDHFSNPVVSGGSIEGAKIEYTSSNPEAATVNEDGSLNIYKASSEDGITITARIDGNEFYHEVAAEYTLTIYRADQKEEFLFEKGSVTQTISFGEQFSNAAMGGENSPVSYQSSDEDIATVDEKGAITALKAGTVTITAKNPSDDRYNEKVISYELVIEKAEQEISFEKMEEPTIVFQGNGDRFENAATSSAVTAGETDITVEYSIASGDALVDDFDPQDGSFTILGAGTIVVKVSFSSNDRYKEAFASYVLTVEKKEQEISFEESAYRKVTGEDFDEAPTASESSEKYGDGAITYAVSDDENSIIRSIDPDTGEIILTYEAGTATITATKAADQNYHSASASYMLTVEEWDPEEEEQTYYELSGDKINDSGWFTGNVSIIAKDGYEVGFCKTNGIADWQEELVDVVTEDGADHTVSFYIRRKADGYISRQYTKTIKKDESVPNVEIKAVGVSAWEKLLTIITFGSWGKDTVDFTIDWYDEISDETVVEYYIDFDHTEVLKKEELDAIDEWIAYTDGISINKDTIAVVYAKVTDLAGHIGYASTNGVVFDGTKPDVKVEFEGDEHAGVYYSDVKVRISVTDKGPSSGLKSVEYWTECDGVRITGEDNILLYQFDMEDPSQDDLVPGWNTDDLTDTIVIDAEDHNSDNIVVYVKAVDNAGNVQLSETPLRICVTEPQLEVSFEDDPEVKNTYNDVYYYSSNRKAEIKITGRTSIFEEHLPEIVVDARDFDGNVVENAYTITDWVTVDPTQKELASGSTMDDAVHTAYIEFTGNAAYTFHVIYTNNDEENAFGFYKEYLSEAFVVDEDSPAGEITIASNKWNKLIGTLTFHLWSNQKVLVKAEATDATSPVKSVLYYKSDSDKALTREELDDLNEEDWKVFEAFEISEGQFTIYLKITDFAENYSYISSDGYMVETKKSNITVTFDEANENGYYHSDVNVGISVADEALSSGIQKIEYQVTCDGKKTQEEVLYSFSYGEDKTLTVLDKNVGDEAVVTKEAELTQEMLKSRWDGSITVNAAENNSDHVKVFVKATDNAGNVSEYESEELKIDVTAPKIEIVYDVNQPYFTDHDREYYGTDRIVTISITERTSCFDPKQAMEGILFSGTDVNGDEVLLDKSVMMDGSWITTEGNTPDEAVHTIKVKFTTDANYRLSAAYTDRAGNMCEYAEGTSSLDYFTIDKTDPTAEICISEYKWTKLLETLTFGIWSKDQFEVSAMSWDETSPTKMEYYISNADTSLTVEDLKALAETAWKDYEAFTVDSQQQFAVYLRVTDYAGNRIFLNSDGHILDKTASLIKLTPDSTNITHNGVGVYKKDVKVQITVTEPEPYSGLQTVKYWVLCDGEKTQEEILYSYDYTREADVNSNGGELSVTEWYESGKQVTIQEDTTPRKQELISAFDKVVTVAAAKNNSCDVMLYVEVMDNAGNYAVESLALDIDITAPVIQVTYDNNAAYKTVNNKGYFPAERTATVVITERTSHYNEQDAANGIQITAKDANGKVVIEDCSSLVSRWKTVEGRTADAATHTATITYSADANYTFAISYTDKAGNKNQTVNTAASVAPYTFTVDKTAPTGTVTVGTLGTWNKLITTLTFGLWSRATVKVSGTSADVTSTIESVSYYKTADTKAKTVQELGRIQEWKTFSGFNVNANEQFVVYMRIVDDAGNTTYISTDGVIVDNVKPVVESISPMITITPEQPVNGIYKTDVKVAVKVEDPKSGSTNAYSGLKEIRYEVYNMGRMTQEGILYTFSLTSPTQSQLCQVWEKEAAITVDKELNNSNDVKIKVYAVDNIGNAGEASETIKIDIIQPVIEVRYDNNDGDTTFADNTTDAFFKANRTATITVTERNFDPDNVKITITNTGGVIPKLSGWTTKQGSGNGDDAAHTATITYSADGDYSFAISCTDLAGNTDKTVNYGNSLAPEKFTIDKTLPIISVSYDNNDAQNGNYYKEARTATITVTEHNFEASRVKPSLNAADNGQPADVPAISSWVGSGDVHTATITYSADALYTFDFDYEDKAGNQAADMAEQSFYVDKTNPLVTISKIVDESANNEEGNIGFVITATDTNFDVFLPVLTAVIREGDSFATKQLEAGTFTNINNGKEYTVTNLDADGIYRITCTVTDKAGNEYSEVTLSGEDGSSYVEPRSGGDTLVTFSVNREGSTYETDLNTMDLAENYYVQNVTEDVVVIEINADPLLEYLVTLNGKTLTENVDYVVTQEGGNGAWVKYIYTINKALFEEEGEYKVVISSRDKAENDAFSDVKGVVVNFVVDRTAPTVAITGLATNGRYQTEEQIVTLIPTDDGGALKTLIVCLVDDDGNILKELVHLEEEALSEALEADSGKIAFAIAEGLYQNVRIVCSDYAVDENGDTNTYTGLFTNVSVSSSAFMIFWANKPLRYGVIGGAVVVFAAGGALTMFKKTKRKKAR